MGWFWWRALAAMRYPTPLGAAQLGYFLGHVGKYVPGKAMAVFLRLAAIRRWVPSTRIGLTSAVLETLTMMTVGGVLASVISILASRSNAFISLVALAMAIAVGVPTLPPVLRWLARFGVGWFKQDDAAQLPLPNSTNIDDELSGIGFGLIAEGWFAAGIYWLLNGFSLWCMLRAIGVDELGLLSGWPMLIAATAFSQVAGFISMLPAGLGVRDAALMQLLVPICGDANALIIAILMRLVWLVSELVTCGILYVGVRNTHTSFKSDR